MKTINLYRITELPNGVQIEICNKYSTIAVRSSAWAGEFISAIYQYTGIVVGLGENNNPSNGVKCHFEVGAYDMFRKIRKLNELNEMGPLDPFFQWLLNRHFGCLADIALLYFEVKYELLTESIEGQIQQFKADVQVHLTKVLMQMYRELTGSESVVKHCIHNDIWFYEDGLMFEGKLPKEGGVK